MIDVPSFRPPFPAFNFYITLIDVSGTLATVMTAVSAVANYALGGFQECSGLETTMQIEEYQEGGRNEYVHKLPGRVSHSAITLRRGMGFTDGLWLWLDDYRQGRGKRRHGVIALMNELRVPVKIWAFKEGLPVRWTGPTLHAAQSQAAIESLEITHQGLLLLSPHTGLAAAAGQLFG